MRKLVLLSIGVLMAFMLIMFAPNAYAEEQDNPWVATYDTSDNPKTQFNLGVTVRIKAYSHITPYHIHIFFPNGTLFMTIGPINPASYSGDFDNITTDLGWWTLQVFDKEAHYGSGMYFVIPTTPLGVATALAACFTGLGVVRRLRRTKKKLLG